MTAGPRESHTTATVTTTHCTHSTDVAHESHCVCMRTLHRHHQSCSSWHVTTKVLRRKALTQHASDCMPAHVTVCDFISRACMCRNGAKPIVLSAPRALRTMPQPEKPAQAQWAASGGDGGSGQRCGRWQRHGRLIDSAPSRPGSGVGRYLVAARAGANQTRVRAGGMRLESFAALRRRDLA